MDKKKILLVDDDRTFIALITAKLSEAGYEVIVARDGAEGLERAQNDKPDLVILDVLMPAMTGYDFAKRIMDLEEIKNIPLIVISARRSMKDYFPEWAIYSFIPKPFRPEELLSKVREALKESEKTPGGIPGSPQTKDSCSGRSALVIGPEDFANQKIRLVLESHGFAVMTTTDEKGSIRHAVEMRPDLIFCKFHEDPAKFDAEWISKQLKEKLKSRSFRFVVFCDLAVSIEARKIFGGCQILTYDRS
ncbi:MAG: response regulator [Candidatus Omnitrophica bacterium]|nr:response regulator [Candidatus Omnitrophota bacterium]